jgi:hypothetical protein
MVGARARAYYDKMAKERMANGGHKAGRGRPAEKGKAKLPDPLRAPQSRDQAGKAVGVSGRMIDKLAKERQRNHGNTAPGKEKNTCGKTSTGDSGQSRDQAGKAVGGVSG